MKKEPKSLTEWDWGVLVSAWRYFEARKSAKSSAFPARIIRRFFKGGYDEKSCQRIAYQFADVDHGLRGEQDWIGPYPLLGGNKRIWCKFYEFCKGYYTYFKTLVLDGDYNGQHVHKEAWGFYCEYTDAWYLFEDYVANPSKELVCPKELIKEVK